MTVHGLSARAASRAFQVENARMIVPPATARLVTARRSMLAVSRGSGGFERAAAQAMASRRVVAVSAGPSGRCP